MSSEYGEKIKATIFGESHGPALGIVIDGLPAGVELNEEAIKKEMDRRAPGRNAFSTQRGETDAYILESGYFQGRTTGMPLAVLIPNKDAHSKDYSLLKDVMRPSHGDYPGYVKYKGYNDYRGGGAFSGRLTAPLVFLGAVSKQILATYGIYVGAHLAEIGGIKDKAFNPLGERAELFQKLSLETLPTVDPLAGEAMAKAILAAREEKDSLGGIVECMAIGLPVGLGEPYFDSVESRLSHGLFAIPAMKGLEFGRGFALAQMKGSEANDSLAWQDGEVTALSNNNGGIQGGLTTGLPLSFRAVFKPTPSIGKTQQAVNMATKENVTLEITGRHDPCIVQRALVVVEAVTAWTILDLLFLEKRG